MKPSPPGATAKAPHELTEAQQKLIDEEPSQTLAQQENMKISGTNARHMVMQKLMRKSEVREREKNVQNQDIPRPGKCSGWAFVWHTWGLWFDSWSCDTKDIIIWVSSALLSAQHVRIRDRLAESESGWWSGLGHTVGLTSLDALHSSDVVFQWPSTIKTGRRSD